MPFYDVVCHKGHTAVDVFARVSEYPPCVECGAPTERLWTKTAGIEDVTWPGGKVFENLGHEPVRCDSPADLRREMKKRNLEPFVRHVDGDQHVPSWSSMTQAQLDGARALLERVGQARGSQPQGDWIESLTLTEHDEVSTITAPRGTFGVFG